MTALLTQHTVSRVLGASRLRRLLRAGWLTPVERNACSILFSPRDVHRALTKLEYRRCPPDRIAVASVRAWEKRNGRAYVRKEKAARPDLSEIKLDFSGL